MGNNLDGMSREVNKRTVVGSLWNIEQCVVGSNMLAPEARPRSCNTTRHSTCVRY